MKLLIMPLAAFTLAFLVPGGSARAISRRHSDNPVRSASPAYHASRRPRPVIPSECPSISSIDVKSWAIHYSRTPETSIVGLSQFYYRKFGMGVHPELACTRADIRWIGRIKVGGGDTCAYLVDLKYENGSTCETYIAKTPAHKLRGAYQEIKDTDARLASLSLYHLKLWDRDGRSWALEATFNDTPGATYGTAERFLQRVGLRGCRASIADVRQEVSWAALEIFEEGAVVLSDDTLQPWNIIYHENSEVKIQFLELSIREDSDSTSDPEQATAILDRSIAAAFPDSLCDQFQGIIRYEASHAEIARTYRLRHVH